MNEGPSALTTVLEAILEADHCEEGEDELSIEESRRVRSKIREFLQITDSPDSRLRTDIADFIYRNCEGQSCSAAERYLSSCTAKQIQSFNLVDVLEILQPGRAEAYEELADENEAENRAGNRPEISGR